MGDVEYWQAYYSNPLHSTVPSQFAAFVVGEFVGLDLAVLDLGCGDGRDSYFFSNFGFNVVGVDSSQAVNKGSAESGRTTFVHGDVTDRDLISSSTSSLRDKNASIMFYARFLLHALSDSELQQFLFLLSEFSLKEDFVAFEFRTREDDFLPKVTASHFRRGLSSLEVANSMMSLGFRPTYSREGFGFAKFRNDDAHVARQVFVRES